jgi:uncharacterized membrane protein YagU involved in acid resistance
MATSSMAVRSTENRSFVSTVIAGGIAGMGGGAVFGMMMALMGMLPMVAMLVGSQSAGVGFLVHMVISAGIGAFYGLIAGRLPQTTGSALVAGMINGVIWWVLGALVLMPLMLGMGDMVFHIGTDQWFSLMGHVIFGVVTGLLFVPVYKRI